MLILTISENAPFYGIIVSANHTEVCVLVQLNDALMSRYNKEADVYSDIIVVDYCVYCFVSITVHLPKYACLTKPNVR